MAEYIEQEALLLRIDCHGTNKFGMLDEDIRAFIKAQPAADVAPVVHSRWRESGPLLECQSCGEIYSRLGGNAGQLWDYCPNCGAKMDGGDNDAAD